MRIESICFSDLHISPETAEDASEVLSQISEDILNRLPNVIVCVGDIGTFDSHNRKSATFATADVKEERKAVRDVLCDYLFKPIFDFNCLQKIHKKKLYKPLMIFCLGNHDKAEHKWFESFFKNVSERLKTTVHCFNEDQVIEVAGVWFKHTFDKGISGTAHTTCAGVLKDLHSCCVQGHRHVREIAEDRDLEGHKMFAICLPCATLNRPEWAGESSKKWDTGWLRLSWDSVKDYHYEFMEFDYDRVFTIPEAR